MEICRWLSGEEHRTHFKDWVQFPASPMGLQLFITQVTEDFMFPQGCYSLQEYTWYTGIYANKTPTHYLPTYLPYYLPTYPLNLTNQINRYNVVWAWSPPWNGSLGNWRPEL